MTLLEVNKGRSITLPASIRKKYSLKPGSKLEIRERNGKIELTPLVEKEDVFALIDGNSRKVAGKELAALKRKVRLHALLH